MSGRRFPLRLALVCACVGWSCAAEPAPNPRRTGTPILRVWRAQDYNASPVNWRILQHPATGFIYVANNFGVLEFDGAVWRLLAMPRGGAARTLLLDERGRVWAGGIGELARLDPDVNGRMQMIDLTEKIAAGATGSAAAADPEEGDRPARAGGAAPLSGLGTLSRIVAGGGAVYVRLPDTIARFAADDTVQLLPARGRLGTMWWMEGRLHVESLDADLMVLADGKLQPSPGTGRLGAFAAQRVGETWRLLTTQGVRTWAGSGQTPRPLRPDSDALLADETIFSATFLDDGRAAFGTTRSGVLIFDSTGRLDRRIDRNDGLPANHVNSLAEDTEGGLWLAMHNGIARVQLGSPLAIHGLAQGLSGGPRHVVRAGERLFVTHGEGLAWRDDADGTFHAVPGFPAGSHRAMPWREGALVTAAGLHQVTSVEQARSVINTTLYGVTTLRRHPTAVLASSALALRFFQPDTAGRWAQTGQLRTMPAGADDLVETDDGIVWAAARTGAVWRVDLRGGLAADAPAQAYGPERGVPPALRRDAVRLVRLGRDLLASSARWLLRYDAAADRFVPETRFPELFDRADDHAMMTVPAADGGAWFYIGGESPYIAALRRSGDGWRVEKIRVPQLADIVPNHLFDDAQTHTLWIAAQGALISVDLDWQERQPLPPLRVAVRRVIASDGEHSVDEPVASGLALPPGRDGLRFEFAAPTFRTDYRGRADIRYRTRLDGFDHNWTAWSDEPRREFTNLPPRALTFRVQAMDFTGRVSDEATVAFRIAPPWWRTGPAVVGGALLGVLAVAGFVRLRTHALHRRAEQLEGIVAERTRELQARNAELARLHQLDLDETTAARLAEEKARLEMLRYQLNPHFLFNALGSIRSLVHRRPEEADEMATQLADFCRTTLTRTEANGGSLRDELDVLTTYLDMEKTRWRARLQVHLDTDPAAMEFRLPPFLLLPLVENAIKYGTRTNEEIVQLVLTTKSAGAGVAIEVANTGRWVDPASDTQSTSTRIGLENIRQRLRRHFPRAHEFTIITDNGWVRVRLRLDAPATQLDHA